MIASTEHKLYRNMLKKGNNSILQALRKVGGWGKGLIAGGIVLLIFTLPITILCLLGNAGVVGSILFSAPGILLIAFGIPMNHKREASWLSYYQEQTGYSEGELLQIDRELADPSTTIVTCKAPNAAKDSYVACFFTEHYMVMNGMEPYVRRLDDIIAVAFSDSTDIWHMVCLSKSDQKAAALGLFTETQGKVKLCREIMQELYRRNPNVLCGQEIVCDGKRYILERDSAEILRLYQEGRTLGVAR